MEIDIKFKDLKLFMQHAERENPEHVRLIWDNVFCTLGITDSRNNYLVFKLFERTVNTTPELITTSKLYAIEKPKNKKEHTNE